MHGIIHVEWKNFVVSRYGLRGWTQIAAEMGAASRFPLPQGSYPDSELLAGVAAAVGLGPDDSQALLEQFGRHLAGVLLATYAPLLQPDWRTLDLIENTDTTIHTVIRSRDPEASPPHLRTMRLSPTVCRLSYTSARRLCALARGLIGGVAQHRHDLISIRELTCMLKGAEECCIEVELLPLPSL